MAGTVELKPDGLADWIPAKTGDTIAVSTVISTGFKSTALISIGNSSLLVRPLTRLSLEELLSQDGTEMVRLGLRIGRLRVEVSPPIGSKADFTIRTPIATASVRGTAFDIDTLNLRVSEGTVRYEGALDRAARPVLVNAGQVTWVDSGGGGALNPLEAAEASRSLPAIPGADSAPEPDTGARQEAPRGSLSVVIDLESK
jgi:hypothetical protein